VLLAVAAGLLAAAPAGAATAFPTAKKPSLLVGKRVNALVRSGPAVIVAGTNAGAFRSTDGGKSFRPTGLAGNVTAVVADQAGAKVLYAASGSTLSRSADRGATWTALAPLVPEGQTPPAQITSLDAAGPIVVAGTDVAVFQSNDAGATWTRVGPDSRTGLEAYLGVTLEPRSHTLWTAGNTLGISTLASNGYWYQYNEGLPANRFEGGTPTGWRASNVTFPGGAGNPIIVSVCGQYYALKKAELSTYQWQSIGGPTIGRTVACTPFAPAKISGNRILVGNVRAVGVCSYDSGCALVGRLKPGGQALSVALGAPAKAGQRPRVVVGTQAGITFLPAP
jgi:hypothetical protein